MATVKLSSIFKIYPGEKGSEVTAVRDFNIDIADREFVVFVGPSGCGKSTTLRMIAGLEEISQGEIKIGDRVVNNLPPKDRDIAMVFQNYALYPHMSVLENMAFGLKLRKLPKAEITRRVNEAAEILGLSELLARKPRALSGGQRQRVALGRAIVRQPKVFLFDEPLSNLDAKMRVQMRAEIVKLHQRLSATMIYVTHDQVEAMTMGTRIVVMDAVLNPETGLKEGVVQQIDSPIKLYNEPANLFVGGFLGSPPMNFLKGSLEGHNGDCEFVESGEGGVRLPLGRRPSAAAHMNRPVILGLRPEHCEAVLPGRPPSEKPTIRARVQLVEPMGAETYFHIATASGTAISRSRTQADHSPQDGWLDFEIDATQAHLFDPESQLRIA